MDAKPEFKYFYGTESDSYTFYRIPKVLIIDERFKSLSNDAKILYGLMLDRMSLSVRNGWFDKENRVYIYYSMEEVMEDLNCSKNKALKSFSELDTPTGIGLIERVKQGQGKPSMIYVKNFLLDGMTCSEVQKREVKTSLKGNSRVTNFGSQESQEMNPNNTNINNTELNNTDSNLILSVTSQKDTTIHPSLMGSDEIDVNAYARIVRRNLEIDLLIQNSPFEEETFEGIYELVLETVISRGDSMVIGSNRYPMSLVRSKFLKLNSSHVEYVMDSLKANTTKVRNIKKYMLATLFNAPTTISSYYQAEVNHDFPQYARAR
ncbi:MAG: replication initiator protein A [Lachnospiraceae bacterium]|nr:replication initiator protein A [Lachnospiraceae bacterium]